MKAFVVETPNEYFPDADVQTVMCIYVPSRCLGIATHPCQPKPSIVYQFSFHVIPGKHTVIEEIDIEEKYVSVCLQEGQNYYSLKN